MTQTFTITNGDWTLRDGTVVLVRDGDKAYQDSLENALISQQPNGTGAGLDELVGKVDVPLSVEMEMRDRLRAAFRALIAVQAGQAVNRTAAERLRAVEGIRTAQVENQRATAFVWEVAITTYDYARRAVGGAVTGGG